MSTNKKNSPIQEQQIHLTDWRDLPRIELYMDQVIAILQEEMRGLWVHAEEAKISASMVNNYVKVKLVPAPLKKRYERQHICALLIVFVLKSVLSMQELAILLPALEKAFEGNWEHLHNCFISNLRNAVEQEVFNESVSDAHEGTHPSEPNTEIEKILKHAVLSFAERLRAQRLLSLLKES